MNFVTLNVIKCVVFISSNGWMFCCHFVFCRIELRSTPSGTFINSTFCAFISVAANAFHPWNKFPFHSPSLHSMQMCASQNFTTCRNERANICSNEIYWSVNSVLFYCLIRFWHVSIETIHLTSENYQSVDIHLSLRKKAILYLLFKKKLTLNPTNLFQLFIQKIGFSLKLENKNQITIVSIKKILFPHQN